MNHLSHEELLDIAEGAREAPAHLHACTRCQEELAELRAVMASVTDVDVPEPSPLFWNHLSARVREAVEAEGAPRRSWFGSWRIVVPVAALAAAAAIVVAVSATRHAAVSTAQPAATAAAVAVSPVDQSDRIPLADPADSPSFAFVVDLANDMDMDAADVAGLTTGDAADHAVAHLTDDELRTLAELLREQIPNGRVS